MANTNPSRAMSTATFALLFVAAATLLQLLAPATSSAMAEDVRYQWSGTMTVSREVDGPDAGNSYSMTTGSSESQARSRACIIVSPTSPGMISRMVRPMN